MKVTFVAAADKKPVCRELLMQQNPGMCVWPDMRDLKGKTGSECCQHRRMCVNDDPIDVLSCGLLCHPFSFKRFKGGSSDNTGPTEIHCEYSLVMTEMPKLVEALRPGLCSRLRLQIDHDRFYSYEGLRVASQFCLNN